MLLVNQLPIGFVVAPIESMFVSNGEQTTMLFGIEYYKSYEGLFSGPFITNSFTDIGQMYSDCLAGKIYVRNVTP